MAEARVTVDVTGLPEVKAAIAELASDLKAYRDYYGTSPAQVRHLQACESGCCSRDCSGDDGFHDRCPDYPTE